MLGRGNFNEEMPILQKGLEEEEVIGFQIFQYNENAYSNQSIIVNVKPMLQSPEYREILISVTILYITNK
jgi:hypothetical protein